MIHFTSSFAIATPYLEDSWCNYSRTSFEMYKTAYNTVRKSTQDGFRWPSTVGLNSFLPKNWNIKKIKIILHLPWWTSRGLGRLVTQVWGHINTLAGWSEPSKNFLRVSDKWMPPRGVLGKWLGGTSARQYIPTWWMLSTACSTRDIHWKLCSKEDSL